MADPDREYPTVVASAVEYLINIYKTPDKIGPDQIEEAVTWKQKSRPDIIDAERAGWLRQDLRDMVDHSWETLTDRKNRGRRDEIIRGLLR